LVSCDMEPVCESVCAKVQIIVGCSRPVDPTAGQ
jgi:hypothetical protein